MNKTLFGNMKERTWTLLLGTPVFESCQLSTNCVTLGKLFNFSEPELCVNGDNNDDKEKKSFM